MNSLLIGYIILCMIFGTTFLAVKTGINAGFAPFMFGGIRFFIAGSILLMYVYYQKMLHGLQKRDWQQMILVGTAMTTIKFAALYWALQFIPSGSSALMVAIFPIMVVLASYLVDREKITFLQRMGLFFGFFGVYLIVDLSVAGAGTAWIFSALAIMGGEFVNALGAVYSRKILNRGISPVVLNSIQMLAGSLGLILLSLMMEPSPLPHLNPTAGWLALAYLVIAGSIVGAGIYYWLIKMMGPLIPSTWSYVSPVIALIVGMQVLGEVLTWRSILGAFVVIGGVILINYEAFARIWKARAAHQQEVQ